MEPWTVVTGASEGLGVEFARIAVKAGRNVVLTARSEDKLNALADELRKSGTQIEVIPADLSDPEAAAAMWEAASAGRHIDVLVNNAGLGSHGLFAKSDWSRELQSIEVNMIALTYLMKQAIPHMEAAGGGRVLNVASVAAFMPGPNMAVYHATKAYVLSLSEAVAEELGTSSKVTVTALCPGPTRTNFFKDAKLEDLRLLKSPMVARAFDVAELGWLESRIGKRIVVPGFMNKLFAFMPRIAPRFILTRMTNFFMGKA